MAFCTNCGSRLEDDGRFCSICGTAVEPAPEPTSAESLSKQPATSSNPERASGPASQPSTVRRLIVPALILVIIAAIVGFALSGNGPEGDQFATTDADRAEDEESPIAATEVDPTTCEEIADLSLIALQDVLDALGTMTADELEDLDVNTAIGEVPDALNEYETVSAGLDERAAQSGCAEESPLLVCHGLGELQPSGEAGGAILSAIATTWCPDLVVDSNGTPDEPQIDANDGTQAAIDSFTREAVTAIITGPEGHALVAPDELRTLFAWADNAVPFGACDTASPGDAEASQFVTDADPRLYVTRVTWFPSVEEAAAYFDYMASLVSCIEYDDLFETEVESQDANGLLVVTSTSVFLRDPTEAEGWAGQQGDLLTTGPIIYGRRANLIVSAFVDGPVPVEDVLSLFK